ncbi:MAG: competence/damage-inducible protein A [Elusimicrobia bacterium]|nr:competence/damage-inducible protein A [Elusimicrobiota bacterium]
MKEATAARVEVVCVGTELLSGKVNTHTAWLAGQLGGIGLAIARETALPDSLPEMKAALSRAWSRSDLLVVCGGLGPTFDDLTREAVAGALGRELRYQPRIYAVIEAKLKRFYKGRRVPEENRRQAFVIAGAKALDNAHGSAPGQILHADGKTVVLLPGPPWELKPIFARLLPGLKARYAPKVRIRKTVFHLCGIAESDADERLQPFIRGAGNGVELTILAGQGLVDFHVTARGSTDAKARARLAAAERRVRALVGDYLFGKDGDTLESVVGGLLRKRRLALATAESCTAGMLAAQLTRVAGSSGYYLGGAVAYANAAKGAMLGVPASTLEREGAVSERCAKEMAEGVRGKLGAGCGVSITGIAGPGGGTKNKPVGLVYIGISIAGRPTHVRRHVFTGARDQIRERSAVAALTWLYRALV